MPVRLRRKGGSKNGSTSALPHLSTVRHPSGTHLSERTVEPVANTTDEKHYELNYTARLMQSRPCGRPSMLRALLRIVMVLVIVAAVAAFFFGYRFARGSSGASDGVTGTSGAQVDVDSARDAGAKVGETVAEGANQVQRAATDAGLTAKIKSKMALDDTVKAINIDVD